jgi:hypothetical protein
MIDVRRNTLTIYDFLFLFFLNWAGGIYKINAVAEGDGSGRRLFIYCLLSFFKHISKGRWIW